MEEFLQVSKDRNQRGLVAQHIVERIFDTTSAINRDGEDQRITIFIHEQISDSPRDCIEGEGNVLCIQKCVNDRVRTVSAGRVDTISGFHGRASSAGDSSVYVSDEDESDVEASAYYAHSTKGTDTSVKISDENVGSSANGGSSVYLSEEDIEVELRENLERDSSSGFSVNISDIETDGNNDNNTDFQGQDSEDAEVEFKKKTWQRFRQ